MDCHTSFKWKYPTSNPYSKPVQRYKNIAWLRQEALETARIAGADYLLVRMFLKKVLRNHNETRNISIDVCFIILCIDSGCGLFPD